MQWLLCAQFHLKKPGRPCFKLYLRTQEAEETVLVFDNYSNNQEFFIKQQERTNRVHIWENSQKCPKVKPINNTLKTQRIKLNSLTDFAKYIQWDQKHSKRKGNAFLSSRDVAYRMNSSELKTLFASNLEEAETNIVCCCSSFNELCIVKAKDIDLTLFNFDDLCIYSSTTQARLVHANRQRFSC